MAMRFATNPIGLMTNLRKSVRMVSIAAREVLSNLPESDLSSLKNGFRIASEANGRPTATVGIWIDAGSRFETEENNGVANFFEHMIYKGTMKRAQSQLEKDLEGIGARLTSYTSREHTAFYAQCLSKDVEKVVGILADMIRNSKLDEATIEKERSVILRKLEEAEDNYEGVVFDNLHAAAFQGTPLAKSMIGTTNVIKSVNRKMLHDFVEDSYKPVRMVLTAVGGVDHGQLMSLSEKYFGDMSNDYARKIPGATGTRFTGSEFRYRDDNVPFMYGAIAVEGISRVHHDFLPLQVANTFVGCWDRTYGSSQNAPSRLAQKLSLAPDLHQYKSFSISYKDTGLFGIYFVVDGKDHDDTLNIVKAVQKEWKHLSSSVSDEEIDRVKNMLKTNLFQSLETNAGRADDIAKQVLDTGKIQSMADLEQDIERIDKSAVREAMSRQVYDRDIACAGVGRTEAWPTYSHVRYGMSWWRL
ncbi:Cytochrome b-c1 complex subunit 1, mitochondrial [Toxocara canis]|uniref:Cytochrome b-c1 complex subunit 1, mitochondrial n=1 Tax=Toxocara canis TaxID=6265 RepID=A0A0B2VW76_TOXCA|nr:Cytochrome b-c1 complex subunit 1, mitochondrial [Toxocara canis]